jgi:Fic family protein
LEEGAAAVAALDHGAAAQLGALGGFLLRTESVATSKIERIAVDLDDFARALAGHVAGDDARLTAAAVHAIAGLVESAGAGPITVEALHEAHRALLADDRFEATYAGGPRPMQNWVGGNDFTPRLADYVPPPADLVGPLLDDLVVAANRRDLSALALAAIVHAQFESIHPYTDGNGRVGRALLNAVLRRRRLTTRVVVPIASAILADVPGYFARLDAYRAGDVDGFVAYVAANAVTASTEAFVSAEALAALPAQWRDHVQPRRNSAADKLLDRLLDAPVLTDRSAAAVADASVRRAADALDKLTSAGVLTEVTGLARDRVWVAGDVLDEIDRLETRIGRRIAAGG